MARVRGVLALLLVAVLPAACATGPVTEADTPERAVEDSFVAFRQAVLAGDGEKAAALTTAASWDYYRDRAADALPAGPGQLQRLPTDQTTLDLTQTRPEHGRTKSRERVSKEVTVSVVTRNM